MNQVYLIGVVSFPKFGQTQQGKPKCTCKLGMARRKKSPQEQTQYDNVTVTAYGDDAAKLIDKARVMVAGSINSYAIADRNTGQQVKIVQVQANLVLDAPYQQRQQQGYPQQGYQQPPQNQAPAGNFPPAHNDPFNQPNPGGQNNMFPPTEPGGGLPF